MSEDLNLDLYNQIAIRKLKASPEWRWCKLEFIGKTNDVILCGGVPTAFRSGPRKGQRKWPDSGKLDKLVVSEVEYNQERTAWEKKYGICHACKGTGKVKHGKGLRSCLACNATGEPSYLHESGDKK